MNFRGLKVFFKLLLEMAVVLAWIAFVVAITLNGPPLKNILFTAGILVVITIIVRTMTRPIRR